MATQLVPETNLNKEILDLFSDLVWDEINENPKYRETLDAFNKAVADARKTLGRNGINALEVTPRAVADLYGTAMFKLGLHIGSNPMSALTLPERVK